MTHRTSCPTSGWRPAVDRQDDPPLTGEERLEPAVVGQGDGEELVVPVEEVGDGPLGDGHPAADEVGADLGHRPVLGVPEAADEGDDVQPELVVRQREAALGLGPVRLLVGGAPGVEVAADQEAETGQPVQGGDGATVGVVGPHPGAAVRAVDPLRGQLLRGRRLGPGCRPGHRSPSVGRKGYQVSRSDFQSALPP
jgi:hypothetical protein